MLGIVIGIIVTSSRQVHGDTHALLHLCRDQAVLDGGNCGLCVGRIRFHLHRGARNARLPQLQRLGDPVLNLEARGHSVRLKQEFPQPSAERGQIQPLTLFGLQNDLNGFTDIHFALAPSHAAIWPDARWKRHATPIQLSSVHGYASPFALNFGSGRQTWKNGIEKKMMSSSVTMTISMSSAQMVMMGMENEQTMPPPAQGALSPGLISRPLWNGK